MQFVRDVQNAATFRCQLLEHHKQFVHRLGCEHRGGLIENEQFGARQQRANDLHALHLAHTERVHRPTGVHIEPILGGLGQNAGGHLLERVARQPQPHVFCHGHGVEQVEMLEHHIYAVGACIVGVADLHQLPVEP